ncbi:hypothetical protein SAMN05216261_2381 [Algibacter luteus]|uniref:Uncharacterized protein n=1 Tax=Algibacter luteus TaxID=1178825 RepID=A0A1M6FGL5_9FLAO|nr:hypothetical protein SAMN05216261_2381 [Algibacter luteus]
MLNWLLENLLLQNRNTFKVENIKHKKTKYVNVFGSSLSSGNWTTTMKFNRFQIISKTILKALYIKSLLS